MILQSQLCPLQRSSLGNEYIKTTTYIAQQVCRALEDSEVPDASAIHWESSALVKPDVEKELYARFKVLRKKTRLGMTPSERGEYRKAKLARKKQRKARKAERKAKADDGKADVTQSDPEKDTCFEKLEATEDLERKLAKWYEDYATYVLSLGGSFFTNNYTAGTVLLLLILPSCLKILIGLPQCKATCAV